MNVLFASPAPPVEIEVVAPGRLPSEAVPLLDVSALFAKFSTILRDFRGPRADRAAVEYRLAVAEVYDIMDDMRMFSERRLALRDGVRRVQMVFRHIRDGNARRQFTIGQSVQDEYHRGTIISRETTALGDFYRVETDFLEVVEIFGGFPD